MVAEIFITLSLVWYFLAEGATEGYTWASKKRRVENKLIRDRFDGTVANGILDYHGWRTFGESVGIVSAVIAAAFAGVSESSMVAGAAGWFTGWFFYQRALDYVCYGKFFNENRNDYYYIAGLTFARFEGNWIEYVKLLVGTVFFIGIFYADKTKLF